MKVGIIGSGGREHAISLAISHSKKVEKIYCFPGNAGTENIAENVNLNLNDFDVLKKFVIDNKIELLIVGLISFVIFYISAGMKNLIIFVC